MKPNIVFIIVDALRPDYLSSYGCKDIHTQNIEEIAREGVLFENAYSTTNTTDSSLTSLFSGKYPRTHGILNHGARVTSKEKRFFNRSGTKLLPEILAGAGYDTFAVDWIDRWHKRGYKYYEGIQKSNFQKIGKYLLNKTPEKIHRLLRKVYDKFSSENKREAKSVTSRGIDLIRERNNKKPFFLFLHYWDTHTPYYAPEEIPRNLGDRKNKKIETVLNSISNKDWRENLKNRLHKTAKNPKTTNDIVKEYTGAVRFVDSEIGRLENFLLDEKLLENTLLIITSDHGESLIEHGIYFDHHGLYEESIHVPLIMKYPEIFESKRVDNFVQHIEIVPTITDLLSLNKNYRNNLDGKSLIPLIKGEKKNVRSSIFAEEAYVQNKKCIRTKRYKYIYSRSEKEAECRYCGRIHGDIEEFYDLENDPSEHNNILNNSPKKANKMKDKLFTKIEELNEKKGVKEKQRLKRNITRLIREGKI